jgi:hypothetical protein
MFKITVDSSVQEALARAFPTPSSAAARALDKYVKALEKLLFAAKTYGQTPLQRMQKTYSISLQRLANEGGQIGPDRMRLHKWLRENGLELVRCVNAGSNLTGKVSDVQLTSLVTLKDEFSIDDAWEMKEQSIASQQQDELTSGDKKELMALLYPDALAITKDSYDSEKYDALEVDVQSVRNYIEWVEKGANLMSQASKETAIRQARIVLAIANSLNGVYLQKKKPSEFGRMYYEGTSVQNVNKELRRAILGNCWEYDIRSSVISWKMTFAPEYLAKHGNLENQRKEFSATLNYLEDKPDFMRTVRYFVFEGCEDKTPEFQQKLIKNAINAISFGARDRCTGWQDMAGHWNNPSLVNIIKNPEERRKFLGDGVVRKFIQEQNRLDDYIFNLVKSQLPELLLKPCLQTPSGRPGKSKVLSYLYQHAEKQVMDLLEEVSIANGHHPLARVHDAIFFRNRLGAELKSKIELEMHAHTDNPYWRLGAEQLKRYEDTQPKNWPQEGEISMHEMMRRLGLQLSGNTSC